MSTTDIALELLPPCDPNFPYYRCLGLKIKRREGLRFERAFAYFIVSKRPPQIIYGEMAELVMASG